MKFRRVRESQALPPRDRAEFDALVRSPAVQATLPEQSRHCISMHAYAVVRTYPLVVDDEPQPATWD